MRSISKAVVTVVALLATIIASILYLQGKNFELLNTAGEIGDKQRNLMYFTVLLSLIIIIPVFTLTFHITRKYRATNPKARYTPDWDGDRKLETIWWLIPLAIIIVLAIVTWITSHSLDPRRPIESSQTPLKVQVVALEWKWLFIYPDSNVATVNYVKIPEDRPVEFTITADAPMNSFWIPQLGGQVYAMTGMSSKLHLVANEPGTFRGQSANLSGEGFADMTFDTVSVPQNEFDAWVKTVGNNAPDINYEQLVKPSIKEKQAIFSVASQPKLYDTIVGKYMSHGSSNEHAEGSH